MYSTKLSVSIHIMSVIVLMEGQPVTSEYIASSINTNPNCPVGAKIEVTLKHLYDNIQTATEKQLSAISLADIIKEFI